MAFSTQKDFFHVPFMNESVAHECKKACVKLKSYDSSIDDRSWARDDAKQSKFLSELVTCQIPADPGYGEGNDGSHRSQHASERDGISTGIGGDASTFQGLTDGDSLLECANIHLAEYQKIMNVKTTLEKQLEVSNERLKTASEENQKIKEILASKLDSNTTKDFYNKIQKLSAAGKLGRDEENEMLKIYNKMKNMNKSYEILQAENNYLKRLIEKLYSRVTLDNIKTEPEKSNDVGYLQKEVIRWRTECTLLRQMEDDYQRIKQQSMKPAAGGGISEQDTANIKAIIKERNSLREKCKSLKNLEQQVEDLEKKASEAGKVANQLSSNLNDKSKYINKMEDEIQNMQKYYEGQSQNACFREESLKALIEDLKDDLVKAKCQAQKAEMLTMEVACMRNEVLKRDLALNDYDCQYKQLMGVVNELQAIKLQFLQDNQTQTCKNQTDELAFFTRATLDEIMKELKKKGSLNDEFMAAYGLGPRPNDTDAEYNQECCNEMYRLQKQVEDMKKELEAAADRDTTCADTLKRLKDLEAENAKLTKYLDDFQKENERLNEKLKESEEIMTNMLAKIERLDNEINKNALDANKIGKDLEGTIGLVKDISDVQLKNQQLTNAVSAINSRDDQKIIDDLRRQLEEELAKLNKCQQDNDNLIKEGKERENEFKKLKDLNNKLEADKKKLEAEKRKLEDDNNNLIYSLNNPKSEGNVKIGNDIDISDKDNSKDKSEVNKDSKEDKKMIIPSEESIDDSNDSDNLQKNSNENKKETKVDMKKTLSTNMAAVLRNDSIKGEAAALGDSFVDKTKPKGEAAASRKNFVVAKPTKRIKNKAVALDDFANKKSESLKFNLYQGRCLEKELRKILDEFIQEYGFCSCRLNNPKSKLHDICHKLYHCGINNLSFQELAYLYKKIYAKAEKLVPGCLLDMILNDHKEEAINKLTSVLPHTSDVGAVELNFKVSGTNLTEMDQKCCCCKNELCCNNSEEMLKDKVNKLEKDIEIAREYLDTLKYIPLDTSLQSDIGDSTDNSTFRASSPVVAAQQKSSSTKQFKKLKARLMKHPDINCF